MTALNYILTKDSVMISMDSLITGIYGIGENEDKVNVNFEAKMYPLPQFNAVICGTGSAQLKKDWYNFASTEIISRDIKYLNKLITEKLLEFEEGYKLKVDTSIYQFGFDEDINEFVGFVYSTNNGYKSQKLDILEGVCKIDIIPMISSDKYREILEISKFETIRGYEEFLINIMKEQKRDDDLRESSNRAGIGGDIHFLYMEKDFYTYKRIHRFDDYDEVYENICLIRLV